MHLRPTSIECFDTCHIIMHLTSLQNRIFHCKLIPNLLPINQFLMNIISFLTFDFLMNILN